MGNDQTQNGQHQGSNNKRGVNFSSKVPGKEKIHQCITTPPDDLAPPISRYFFN